MPNKYTKNRNIWKKVVPYIRRKPRVQELEGRPGTYDLNKVVRSYSPSSVKADPGLDERPVPLTIDGVVEFCLTDEEFLSRGIGDAVIELVNQADSTNNYIIEGVNDANTITVNGKIWIDFNSNDWLRTESAVDLTHTDKLTMVIVWHKTGTSYGELWVRNPLGGESIRIAMNAGGSAIQRKFACIPQGNVGENERETASGLLTLNTTYIAATTVDWAGSEAATEIPTLLIDDVAVSTIPGGASNNTNTDFGNYTNVLGGHGNNSYDFVGYYRGHALYDRILSSAELTELYEYFATKI